MNNWKKSLGFLILFILLCAIAARLLTRGETLDEYAQNNPEIAYATPERTPEALPTSGPSQNPAFSETASDASSDSDANLSPSPASVPATPAPDTPESMFYYEPLSETVIARITGISYPLPETDAQSQSVPAVNMIDSAENIAVSYEDLRYMSVLYYDFNGEVQAGELICNKKIAQDLLEIFYELYLNEYAIEKIRLIEEYNGDDTASMADNNTSCFNYRVVDGTDHLSKHAYGCAIDINPFYNPYVVYNRDGSGETYISPAGSELYADRSRDFPYKIDENDLCYQLFIEHGFTWGGNWNYSKDYQHFQKMPN